MCEIETEFEYYLKPIFDGSQNFYKKAFVLIDEIQQKKRLYSYNTLVCYIDKSGVHLTKDWAFSATTLRHVKEFLRQNGYTAETKKQIAADYMEV